MTNEDRVHILREEMESFMRWSAKVNELLTNCERRCVYYEKDAKELKKEYVRLRDMVQNMFIPEVVYPEVDNKPEDVDKQWP